MLPRWDHGAFFQRIAESLLGSGHRITVYDTLSIWREGDDLGTLADRWVRLLASSSDAAPDVLVGNALGGAVVQSILAQEWTHQAKVLLLSAPTVADDALNSRLEGIAATVGTCGLAAALRRLGEVVRGPDHQPEGVGSGRDSDSIERPDSHEQERAGRRLAAGLRLLRDLDVRSSVRGFPGSLLHVYGEQSLLVQRTHLATGTQSNHGYTGIPRAGMRPWADQPDLTSNAVAQFVENDKT
ncbi:hypothetical protein HNR23_004379 [Nocardiopsis mwathae]|uniref:Alpha/beta hydrolase n=1 Tax=Nocardiopsis mwathae TaxID=1472723 RepID=A0A7X0D8S3_9ACTN|nr:hypothetical protein [Nocardiopsis mwathae]MBB6174319.1 hypothetical protein [Nocardiopsis mwathae]